MLNSQVKLIEALRKSSNFLDYTFFFYLELICFFLVCLGFFFMIVGSQRVDIPTIPR